MFEADNQDALNQYLAGKTEFPWVRFPTRFLEELRNRLCAFGELCQSQPTTIYSHQYSKKVCNGDKEGFSRLDSLTAAEKNGWLPLPMAYDKPAGLCKDDGDDG